MALDMAMFQRFAKTYQAGDIIFLEYEPGDTFYLIQAGRVQIVKIMDNIEKNIDILQPGEIFGEMAILEQAPRSATAVALDQVKLLEFNRENFDILMQGNPAIALKLMKLFAKRIYDQKRRFMILTLDDVQSRVADVFLMLSETQSEKIDAENEDERVFRTNADDIAHWAGMSPEDCRQILNHFTTQRRIDIYPEKIVVRNINDFQRFVNSRRNQQRNEI